jgi:hypothetical protein
MKWILIFHLVNADAHIPEVFGYKFNTFEACLNLGRQVIAPSYEGMWVGGVECRLEGATYAGTAD